MLRITALILCLFSVADLGHASNIVELINKGDIDQARREMEKSLSATHRDGTLLFAQALLETDGKNSLQLLSTAEKSGVSPEYDEDIAHLRILYSFANAAYDNVIQQSSSYLNKWENGRYRTNVLRLAAIANEHNSLIDKATRLRSQLAKENPEAEFGQIGKLDQANALYGSGRYDEAMKVYQKLASSKFDVISAPAMYMMTRSALKTNHFDDAIFRFNLLKEGYPDAVGLDDLMEEVSQIEKKSEDSRAEKITGTSYSIQAGVFSDRDNAKNLAKRLKEYGEPVETADKTISGKKYYVVYVGRFRSMEKAMAFKSRLEASEKEAFQVVAR